MWLRDRGFDLRGQLRTARGGASVPLRQQALATLRQMVVSDQASLAQLIQQQGGIVEHQYWVLSALAVELPAAAVAVVRQHPRVRRMVPVRSRIDASFVPTFLMPPPSFPMPQGTANDTNNHNVGTARAIIQTASQANPGTIPPGAENGRGVNVAVLDTGIDQDGGGLLGVPGPHDAFLDPATSQSRVLAHLRAGPPPPTPLPAPTPVGAGVGIDCNNIRAVGGFAGGGIGNSQIAYRACWHSTSAFHGTGMAGIIAGSGVGLIDGHAPEAKLIDVSITVVAAQPPATPNPPTANADPNLPPGPQPAPTDRDRWTTNTATMLNGIQLLRSFLIESGQRLHVLNYSFAGMSDPQDPENVALDELAVDEDVILVASAGNTPDDTRQSSGFYNGLAVGAVHARAASEDPAGEPFVAAGFTAHGPLAGDSNRFYPDVCAVGAGTGTVGTANRHRYVFDETTSQNSNSYLVMPRIDSRDSCSMQRASCTLPGLAYGSQCLQSVFNPFGLPVPANIYLGQGTSEAGAQVAGAASLYRAVQPTATALETKAALVLNVVSPFPGTFGGPPPLGTGNDQTTYLNRNTFGVGFVRDDLLAGFAVRDLLIQPVSEETKLDGPLSEAFVSLPSLVVGARYIAACAWQRRWSVEGEVLVDVDLEVLDSASVVVVARSASRGNSYERAGFVAPISASGFKVRVFVGEHSKAPQLLPVHVVFRRFDADLDPGAQGTQFAPMHAITGVVESRSAWVAPSDCTAPAPTQTTLDVIPNVYASAWGSGPLRLPLLPQPPGNSPCDLTLPPPHTGFNLMNQPIDGTFRVHIEVHPSAISGPVTIGGLGFRVWRPFRCAGAQPVALTFTQIRMFEEAGFHAVAATTNSLGLSSGFGAPVLTTPYTVPAPPAISSVVDTVSSAFDSFYVQVPTAPFAYSDTGNLHIWLAMTGPSEFEVDYANDGDSIVGTTFCSNADLRYGVQIGDVNGPIATVGKCPIVELLTPETTQSVHPSLRSYGEPMLGRSLAIEARGLPPGQNVWLFEGDWSPGLGVSGTCHWHVAADVPALLATSDSQGHAWWQKTIPLSPAMLSMTRGLQCGVQSNQTLTNALRFCIGGGL